MEKATNSTPRKIICPRCKGNGYIKIPHETVEKLNRSVITQCTMCNSQGEIDELEDSNMHKLTSNRVH